MDGKKIAIANDEEKTYDPNFWNNPREAEAFMKQLRSKKRWIEDYEKAESLTDDAEVIAVAVKLLFLAAIFQLSDGLQVSSAGASEPGAFWKTNFTPSIVSSVGTPASMQ